MKNDCSNNKVKNTKNKFFNSSEFNYKKIGKILENVNNDINENDINENNLK